MELPNIHFQDFPIEFKEINPIDFTNDFTVHNKVIIEPNIEGYIHEVLMAKIDLKAKNTVVINASVGSGKSYSIIQTIKEYYNSNEKYLILVATPFVSLVEQYVKDIHQDAGIPTNKIYDYNNLGRNQDINYLDTPIQVLTVNTLLGNPGEDGFKNSDEKRKYLNSLIKKCKETDTKVVFIYDEIHDAIQNFKEEFIFNLWKWNDVIHKNFIISATYNEASKIVIQYLAELTENEIQIIETKRIKSPAKQSKLFLHYSSEHFFTENTLEITSVVESLINENKNIDILCYSKVLAKNILKDTKGIGKKLKDRFGELNDCTSEINSSNEREGNEAPKNRYNNEKCNIGTNFKTGVSIKKDNHAFIIIMPPRATRAGFKNKSGIFSDGANSIIQALARQRKKGEIHIVLPRPDEFNYSSLDRFKLSESQFTSFKTWYDKINYYKTLKPVDQVKYTPLALQHLLLQTFYTDSLEENIENEIKVISNKDRKGLTRLQYPSFNLFKLYRGEDYLANNFKFFGDDLASYITYCAFTNQFINCNLKGISYKTLIFFEEDKIQKELNKTYDKYFGEDYFYSLVTNSNFNLIYNDFRNHLFNYFTLKFKKSNSTDWLKISPYNNKKFEIQLLRFVAIKYYSNNYNRLVPSPLIKKDLDYSRSDYFIDCISIAQNIDIDTFESDTQTKNMISMYQILNHFRTKLIGSILNHSTSNTNFRYLKNKPHTGFFTESDMRFYEEFVNLIDNDELLKNNVFELKSRLSINSFYTKIIEDFFNCTAHKLPSGNRDNVKKINSTKPLFENTNSIINLLIAPDYKMLD